MSHYPGMAALTMCSTPGCESLCAIPGLCRDCKAARNARRGTSGSDRQRRTREYLANHPLCAMGCGRQATILDHIVRLHDGGPDVESNWQGLCRPCDLSKQKWEQQQ